ncbi:short-chain dehydrogenase [Methylobacterium radiotolerans]|uniref:SDR family oxidoreductase n=1 Tax=Methylobacterium TaxID=407 RepID=UPI002F34064C
MKLKNRTALITGGTSGIGLELAKLLLARSNTVIVTGRDQARLDATKRLLPELHIFRSDVGDPQAPADLCDSVLREFPALDTLINNAGIMRHLDLRQQRRAMDITQEIDINLNGPIRLVDELLPHLKGVGNALIVNVTSGLAFVPLAAAPVYSAAKAALHAYTRCLRTQLEGTGIRVVELAPPLTATPLFHGEFAALMPGERGMDVSVLAARAIAGIEKGRQEIRPGPSNVLKVGSRLAPELMFNQMAKVGRASA